ncbi:hypothetical protein Tco_0448208 [Tanacetum coccineum]
MHALPSHTVSLERKLVSLSRRLNSNLTVSLTPSKSVLKGWQSPTHIILVILARNIESDTVSIPVKDGKNPALKPTSNKAHGTFKDGNGDIVFNKIKFNNACHLPDNSKIS